MGQCHQVCKEDGSQKITILHETSDDIPQEKYQSDSIKDSNKTKFFNSPETPQIKGSQSNRFQVASVADLQSSQSVQNNINTLILEDGCSYYNGEVLNGQPHGEGNLVYTDGTSYEGSFRLGKFGGFGKLICIDYTYEGNFENGKKHGKGVEINKDGIKYEGDFMDGSKTGKATLTYMDDSYYQGDFLNGQFHGQGLYVWKNQSRYTGSWMNNLIHGKGYFEWPDGRYYDGEYYIAYNKVFKWPKTWVRYLQVQGWEKVYWHLEEWISGWQCIVVREKRDMPKHFLVEWCLDPRSQIKSAQYSAVNIKKLK